MLLRPPAIFWWLLPSVGSFVDLPVDYPVNRKTKNSVEIDNGWKSNDFMIFKMMNNIRNQKSKELIMRHSDKIIKYNNFI